MTTAEFRALCPDALVLEAIAPGPLMSMNQRTHWATNAKAVKNWRYWASIVGRSYSSPRVDAGLWPDDTPEWVTVAEPRLIVRRDHLVRILIDPRTPATKEKL